MNNWYVITGAPCSGKTTLLKILEQKGYKILDEAARVLIDQEIAKGKTLEEIRRNELVFQEQVLDMKIKMEKELSPEDVIFFDRGIPDSEAYYKLLEVKVDDRVKEIYKNCSYKRVFLLEFFDFKKDYARVEDQDQQKIIHDHLKNVYSELGFDVVVVPKTKTKEGRVQFVLNNL